MATGWIVGLALSLIAAGEDHVVPLPPDKALVFLSADAGREAILESQHDPFFRLLTPIDYQLRLAAGPEELPPGRREQKLRDQFRDAVTDFSSAELSALTLACEQVHAEAERMAPILIPPVWKFLKTDNRDEGGAAYTRHDAIVLSQAKLHALGGKPEELAFLVAHETAHVFSRQHPELRNRLYQRLGFRHVGAIALPDWLEARRITNPDCPTLEHIVEVSTPDRGAFEGVLVTFSKSERFSPEQGQTLFAYLRVGIFPVEKTEQGYAVTANAPPGGYDPRQVIGFFEKIGRNTNYIIHPEEILADNLALVLTQSIRPLPANVDRKLLEDLVSLLNRQP